MKRLLICALCLGTLASGIRVDAQVLPQCDACEDEIEGNYYEIDGKFFHPEHFLCAHCNQSMRDGYTMLGGQYYHASCYEERFLIKCYICGQTIVDAYYQDYWGNAYHAIHRERETECDFCGRLIVGGFAAGRLRLPGGRELCGQCASTAITTTQEAKDLMTRVTRYLAEDGVHVDVQGVLLLLLNRDKLQSMSPDSASHLNGFTDYAFELNAEGRPVRSGANICLLYGMPETQMIAVLAHELMHVWQGSRNPLWSNDLLREGSANYASYLVMRKLDTREAAFVVYTMREDQDPVYGEGFRRVSRYVENHGVDAWLRVLSMESPVMAEEH
jgi:LIM domain/Protein DA1